MVAAVEMVVVLVVVVVVVIVAVNVSPLSGWTSHPSSPCNVSNNHRGFDLSSKLLRMP
jgi:hypothetical protein